MLYYRVKFPTLIQYYITIKKTLIMCYFVLYVGLDADIRSLIHALYFETCFT